MRLDPRDTVHSSALRSSLKSWPELQIRITQLAREGSPPPRLRLLQAKLSRESNQIARGRIRQFESDMPSQAVRSLGGMSGLEKCFRHFRGLVRHYGVSEQQFS